MNSILLYRCPKCGRLAVVNTSVVLTSNPPQYSYYCEGCKTTGYVFCDDINLYPCEAVTYYPED